MADSGDSAALSRPFTPSPFGRSIFGISYVPVGRSAMES
jgi:hypothetical protein